MFFDIHTLKDKIAGENIYIVKKWKITQSGNTLSCIVHFHYKDNRKLFITEGKIYDLARQGGVTKLLLIFTAVVWVKKCTVHQTLLLRNM